MRLRSSATTIPTVVDRSCGVRSSVSTPLQRLEEELVNRRERVLVVTGTGVSCASDTSSPVASWPGMLKHGVEHCRNWCNLSDQWTNLTLSLIAEEKALSYIQSATRIQEALCSSRSGLFGDWLNESIGGLTVRNRQVIDALHDWGVRIATLNYDRLLEDVTQRIPITWAQRDLALRMLRGDADGILHLHGFFQQPETVVFDYRSYDKIRNDAAVQDRIRACFTMGTVVFVGCGLTIDDPNIEGLWEFCRNTHEDSHHSHYHLARRSDLAALGERYAGLPVVAIPYGDTHADLGPFLRSVSDRVAHRRNRDPATAVLESVYVDYQHGLAAR